LRINIVHMGFFYSGGGERVVLEQAKRLRERGHKVQIYSPITRWDKCFPDLLKEVNPERFVPKCPFPLPFREGLAMIASATLPFGVRKLADCDILLCHSQPSIWIGYRINRLLGIPYVGYLHQLTTFIHKRPEVAGGWATTGDFLLLDGLLGIFGRSVAHRLDYICHRYASRLIFNSAWTRSRFEDEYGLSGEVCYPGINFSPACYSSVRSGIITASRHYPWKRIDLAFQVLKALDVEKKPTFFVVGEETSHTRNLREAARRLGVEKHVKFTGFIDDEELFRLYAQSSAYVQTSVEEPFGLGPLEAQSYGTPAVVWGDAGVKETVLDGETGYHAVPYDISDFSSKLQTILADQQRWKSMSRMAKVWASTFDWDTHIDLLESVLDQERR